MKRSLKISPTLAGVAVCALLIILGPLYTAPGYDVLTHTSSDLGAQNTPFAWLMNLGFLALGLGVGVDAARLWWRAPFISVTFVVFAVAMALTGVFSLRPIDPSVSFDETQDALHSLFATIVGFSFSVGAISYMVWSRRARTKVLCFGAGVLGGVLSAAMMYFPDYAGLLQRLMFVVTFTWLVMYLPVRQ